MRTVEGTAPVQLAASITAISEDTDTVGILAASRERGTAPSSDSATSQAGSTTVTVSVLAQQLVGLLPPPGEHAPSVMASRPLMTLPASDTRQIAAALREGLEFSGLFYESHLLEWHQGRRGLSTLASEPQALVIPAADSALGVNEVLAPIVHAQLETLDTGRVRWEGEIWPGMAIRWQVHSYDDEHTGDQRQEAHQHGEQQTVWSSSLNLNLPALGEISAQLTLRDNVLQLRLMTTTLDIADQLDQHRKSLSTNLGSAGIRLDGLDVRLYDSL